MPAKNYCKKKKKKIDTGNSEVTFKCQQQLSVQFLKTTLLGPKSIYRLKLFGATLFEPKVWEFLYKAPKLFGSCFLTGQNLRLI